MDQQQLDISGVEQQLRKQARAFLEATKQAKIKDHNSASILFRLTGKRFGDLVSRAQICNAIACVDAALLSERKKARLKRYDYDLNRHIALHQAKKSLESKRAMLHGTGEATKKADLISRPSHYSV